MKRVLTALVLIPAVLWVVFQGTPLAVQLALTVVALLCLHECLGIARAAGITVSTPVSHAAGAAMILAPALPYPAFLVGFAVLAMLLSLNRLHTSGGAFASASAMLFAVVYACGPFAVARQLHTLSPHWLFFPLLVNWAGDSSAMYVGKAFGRRKLAPTISPNKTWEGTIASLVLGAAAGAGYLLYFLPDLVSPVFAIVLAVLVNVAGQLGDLAESALKRGVDMKDSGSLLPGHGGLLDRMDGALFSFPTLYWALVASGWIVAGL